MPWTPSGVVCHIRADVPHGLAAELLGYARDEAPTADLDAPPRHERCYRELLAPYGKIWLGPAFALRHDVRATHAAVAITRANAELLADRFDEWADEIDQRQPCYCVLERGRAISLCASARVTSQAHEAGVETLWEYRGHGHAATVVTAWAHAVTARGALPMYSTSWDNVASQRVAAKCGFTAYGSDYHIT